MQLRGTTYLDSIEDFVDKLDPGVLEAHLLHLHLTTDRSHTNVKRDHEQHDSKPSKDGRPHGEVEEDEREDDLKRGRPESVEVGSEVHEPLSVHRHQVDYLSNRASLAGLVTETKSLCVAKIRR